MASRPTSLKAPCSISSEWECAQQSWKTLPARVLPPPAHPRASLGSVPLCWPSGPWSPLSLSVGSQAATRPLKQQPLGPQALPEPLVFLQCEEEFFFQGIQVQKGIAVIRGLSQRGSQPWGAGGQSRSLHCLWSLWQDLRTEVSECQGKAIQVAQCPQQEGI